MILKQEVILPQQTTETKCNRFDSIIQKAPTQPLTKERQIQPSTENRPNTEDHLHKQRNETPFNTPPS